MALIAVYFVVIPLLLALVCYPLGRVAPMWRDRLALGGFAVNLLLACILLVRTAVQGEVFAPLLTIAAGGFTIPLGLTINAFGATVSLTLAIVLVSVMLHTVFVTVPRHDSLYFSLLFFATAGLNGFVASTDLIGIYIFGEIISLSFAFLVMIDLDTAAMQAGLQLFVTNEIAGLAFLWGILLTIGENQPTTISSVATWLANDPSEVRGWVCLLFLGALATRIGLAPVHTWLSNSVSHSRFVVGSLLTGGVNLVGAYALLRLLAPTIVSNPTLQIILGLLGMTTLAVGLFSALRYREIRHTLVYFSIAQYGFFVLILSIGNNQALAAATWFLFAMAFTLPILFLSYGVIDRYGAKLSSNNFPEWPIFAVLLTGGLLAAGGVPPFLGFAPRALFFQAGLGEASLWLSLILFAGLLTIALNFWLLARLAKMFIIATQQKESPTNSIARPVEFSLTVLLGILVVVAIPGQIFGQFVIAPFTALIGQAPQPDLSSYGWQELSGLALTLAGIALGGLAYALENGLITSTFTSRRRFQSLRPVGQIAVPLVDGWQRWADDGRFDLYHLLGGTVFSLSRLVSTMMLIATRRFTNK